MDAQRNHADQTDGRRQPGDSPSAESPPKWSWRSRRGLLLLLLVGLVVRAAYLHDYSHSPLFRVAVGPDVEEYDAAATALLAGAPLLGEDAKHGPLYPCLLATLYKVTGQKLPVVRALQLLMGVAAGVVLVLAIGRRYGPTVAICTAILWAGYVPLIHCEAEFFAEGTAFLLNTCVIALLIGQRAVQRWRAGLAGLLLGLSAITHATAVPFAGLILLWLAWTSLRRSWKRGIQTTLAAVVGLALPTVPVAIHNSCLAGELVFVQGTSGLNFYIGNNASADGGNVRPGPDWDRLLALPCTEGGLREDEGHEQFYYRRALAFIRESPGRWLELLGKKAALALSATEITASTPVTAVRDDIRLLRWPSIGFGVLLPLALVGLVFGGGRRVAPAWILVLAYVLLQTIYFPTGRYRVPMLAGMFVLAGLGLAHLISCARERSQRGLAFSVVTLSLGVLVALLPLVPDRNNDPAEGALGRAMAYRAAGDTDNAAGELLRAISYRPDYAPAYVTLGEMLAQHGLPDKAIEHYEAAVAARPDYALAHISLAEALLKQRGDFINAQPHYVRAVELNPEDCRTRFLYARALLVWEEWSEAADEFRFILSRREDPDAQRGLGECLMRLGQFAEAQEQLRRAAQAAPNSDGAQILLTRLWAACPDESMRNAELALEIGQRAASLGNFTNPNALDALAMAQANAGLFEQAVETASAAIQLARERGWIGLRDEIAARRSLYTRRMPYRDSAR